MDANNVPVLTKLEDVIVENVGREMKKPFKHFDKPSLSLDDLIEKRAKEIAEDDLEEFAMKHGIIHDMEYRNIMPDDIKRNGNECTGKERSDLNAAIQFTLEVINKSINNYDEKKFRKWFGINNTK